MALTDTSTNASDFDYIVVGSGAGGGPLAARLAQAGYRVLVLEAGPDHTAKPGEAREVSLVPALHAVSTEHDDLAWRFFVKHYDNPPTGRDPKATQPGTQYPADRIFYPRSSGVGGCTVHNALITIAGPDSDWEDLADYLGDDSWRGGAMRAYFQRLERNEYHPRPKPPPLGWWGRLRDLVLWLFGRDPDHTGGRHGFDGWLHTSTADPTLALHDKQLLKMISGGLFQALQTGLNRGHLFVRGFLRGRSLQDLDPNHSRTQAEHPEGLAMVPLAVCGEPTTIHQSSDAPFVQRGRRSSPRELLHETQLRWPDRLVIQTDTFVTKVLFDAGPKPRAVGVSFLKGSNLYKAHAGSGGRGEPGSVFVKAGGEVILAGGSFNTPQLMMLSGLGDEAELTRFCRDAGQPNACALTGRNGAPLTNAQGAPHRIDLPGVGRNLQDRYEVTVISQMQHDFPLLEGATLTLPANAGTDTERPDRHLRQWMAEGTGLYSSNGAVLGLFKRSRRNLAQPDLFIFGVPLPFYGYELGYSKAQERNQFTWTILKAHTRNNDGTVKLQSLDPLDTPDINFHYFNEASRPGRSGDDPDLRAIVDGVRFVRGIAKHTAWFTRVSEHHPALARPDHPAVSDDEGEIKDWIRREAWGHHACGTCRMGPADDPKAVLDSRFRVRNVDGLRIVDASIFPRIPGYFIVTNVYMASEKAADVIVEDRKHGKPDTPIYPRDLRRMEAEAIWERRTAVAGVAASGAASSAKPVDPRKGDGWEPCVVGLALSGGGIRSATFNLGVIQSMARAGWLRRVDFLSTVSGGGYIGTFLGRWFDRLRRHSETGDIDSQPYEGASARIERELTDLHSPAVAWLRRYANYLAPNGGGDTAYFSAVFLRNFLSVHLCVGLLLFALFGAVDWIRYGLLEPGTAAVGLLGLTPGDFPIGHLLQALLGPFYSPWFMAFELIVLLMFAPRIVAYWIVSPDHDKRFDPVALLATLAGSAMVLFAAVQTAVSLPLLLLGVSPLFAFVHVEMAWRRGRVREEAIGRGSVETQRLRTRTYLTEDLATALTLAAGVLFFAVIDTIGHGLQQLVVMNTTYVKAFAAMGVTLAGLVPVIKLVANYTIDTKRAGPPSALESWLRKQVVAGLLAVALFTIPLIFVSFTAHAAYNGGVDIVRGLAATGAAFLLTAIFAIPGALSFINRSSLSQTYAALLARCFLGATNPLRLRPEAGNVTEVAAGDDIASIRDYKPHLSGGPHHLINMTVNQTVDFSSQRGNRDRQGENVAVSSLGMSIGKIAHVAWTGAEGDEVDQPRKRPTAVTPLGWCPGAGHPLLDETGKPAQRVEMLSLRQWMAISGAAFGPARGQSTSLGTALMFGLANLRIGYWWNSSIAEANRDGYPARTFLKRAYYLARFLFQTQALILSEWIARFPGPWDQYWYLSDGGHFENLGGYELIRRRVPRMIVCDASADPTYQMEGIANLMRKARIDFGAEMVPFTPADYGRIPGGQPTSVGTLDQMKPQGGGPAQKRATLFWVRYHDAPERPCVLMYVKANLTGDESADVRNYASAHPEFPHEPTEDQFFDEEQWESYRWLGEHLMTSVCGERFWFCDIPLGRETP